MNCNEITKTYIQIEKLMNEYLKVFNITYHQWLVMREIYFAQSSTILATNISNVLYQDKRLTSLSLKKLEEFNYILRVDNEKDKRNKYITLTEDGLSTSSEIIEIEDAVENFIMSVN